jgi:O-antigen/teichoic acid export membrane protein
VSLIMGTAAVLNLLLNVILIPAYGILGAAIATSACYLLVTGWMLLVYCRLGQVPVWQTLFVLPSDYAPLRQMLQGRPA